ncbi:MAG: SpoIIE family protein phosphatase [Crocinitomicaceae bacterium]|nr:SpoIIE family protein phosphatase [Crocinitomicaceae bacterium]
MNERTQEIQYQKTLIEEKQIEILDSINYAQRIQRALLATDEILNKNLPEHFVFFQPKDIVSGDFYWAAETENNKFLLITADSTGHGVPGAIMSMLNISALEKAVDSDKLYEPADVLNSARTKIISTLAKDGSAEGGKDGMDCSLIRFDFMKMEISFSGANDGIWIFRNGTMLEFEPDRMPVGKHLRDKIPFNQIEIPILKGDLIFMFTDGFADQFGGDKGKKFKYKSLKNVLIQNAHLSMNEQQQNLANVLQDWKGELEQVDDVCVIGIKI